MSGIMQNTVNETIRCSPRTVEVFRRYGIDSCCGGGLQVSVAAERHGVDPAVLEAELAALMDEASCRLVS